MVWRRALQNPKSALASYKRALALGGSVGLKDLFRAAGGQLDFSARTIRPLVEAVMERLGY
jgi:oligoendopeptidase F